MGTLDIDNAQASDYTNVVEDVEVDAKNIDGVTDQKETEWLNPNWSTQWGYFNEISDLNSALIMKSVWNVGKGWTTEDPGTKTDLDHISGWGTDTFDDILFNMDLISNIGGDSFAEIMREDPKNDASILLNLKPLDPSTIKTVVNGKGIIIRYEQMSKTNNKKAVHKFKPNQILHFCKNRAADQIHGLSKIDPLQKTIDADNESFTDIKQLMHHQAKPFLIFKLKTDDPVKIRSIVSKIDSVRNLGEDLFIPDDENIISWEVVQVNMNAVILQWRDDVRNRFYRGVGLPLIIFSSGGSTESGGKMEIFAHETVFSREQRWIEQQLWNQLGIKIKLNTPTSLLDNLQTDEAKDANQGLEVQPQDVTQPTPPI